MKWYGLYKKIGNQEIGKTKKWDVVAFIDGKEIPLALKYKVDGSPYFISNEEYNYNQCKKCGNYNVGDGYDDISKCHRCKYYNN